MRSRLRSIPMAAAATAALVLTGAPPASASYQEACGAYVADYGSVQMYGCLAAADDDGASNYNSLRPFAKITWRNTNPLNWSACTVRVALFRDNVQITPLESISCLYDARRGTQLTPVTAQYSGSTYVLGPTETGSYHAAVQWYGTYGGQPVRSHENALSPSFTTLTFT